MNPAQAIGDLWHYALVVPVQFLLTHFHNGFASFSATKSIGAFGLAVILVTLIIRTLLVPLFTWQLRVSRKTQEEQAIIAPQMQELRRKYRKDPQTLNAEMMKLYREHGISPFSGLAGCLPLLVQWPVLLALYQGIQGVTRDLHSDLGFLWVGNVTKTGVDACCTTGVDKAHHVMHGDYLVGALSHPAVLILPLLSALATFVQSKMMMPRSTPVMSDQQKQAQQMSRQMAYIMPPVIFIFGITFPQGIALYWVTQSVFMIVQQYFVVGWGSLSVPPWFPGAGRTTKYSRPVPAAALTNQRPSGGSKVEPEARGAAGGDGRRPGAGGHPRRQPVGAGRSGGGSRRKRRR